MKLELHTMEKINVEKAKEYCKKHKMKFKFVYTEKDVELCGENEIYHYNVFGTSEQIEQFVRDNDVIWFK